MSTKNAAQAILEYVLLAALSVVCIISISGIIRGMGESTSGFGRYYNEARSRITGFVPAEGDYVPPENN